MAFNFYINTNIDSLDFHNFVLLHGTILELGWGQGQLEKSHLIRRLTKRFCLCANIFVYDYFPLCSLNMFVYFSALKSSVWNRQMRWISSFYWMESEQNECAFGWANPFLGFYIISCSNKRLLTNKQIFRHLTRPSED